MPFQFLSLYMNRILNNLKRAPAVSAFKFGYKKLKGQFAYVLRSFPSRTIGPDRSHPTSIPNKLTDRYSRGWPENQYQLNILIWMPRRRTCFEILAVEPQQGLETSQNLVRSHAAPWN